MSRRRRPPRPRRRAPASAAGPAAAKDGGPPAAAAPPGSGLARAGARLRRIAGLAWDLVLLAVGLVGAVLGVKLAMGVSQVASETAGSGEAALWWALAAFSAVMAAVFAREGWLRLRRLRAARTDAADGRDGGGSA